MRRTTASILCAAALLSARSTRESQAAETPLRIALIVPSGAEDAAFSADVAYGVALATLQSNDAKAAGAKRPAFEVVTTNAGDSSIASLAFEKASKEKDVGVVAFASESVAVVLEG